MKRIAAFLPATLLVVGVGTSLALPVAGGQTPEARDRSRAILVAWGGLAARRGEVETPRVVAREDGVNAPRAGDLQAPRAAEVQAPRGDDVQAPRAAEVQAPRGDDVQAPRAAEVQAPRGDDVQAPRADKLEAPRAARVQASRACQAREPRWRED